MYEQYWSFPLSDSNPWYSYSYSYNVNSSQLKISCGSIPCAWETHWSDLNRIIGCFDWVYRGIYQSLQGIAGTLLQ